MWKEQIKRLTWSPINIIEKNIPIVITIVIIVFYYEGIVSLSM